MRRTETGTSYKLFDRTSFPGIEEPVRPILVTTDDDALAGLDQDKLLKKMGIEVAPDDETIVCVWNTNSGPRRPKSGELQQPSGFCTLRGKDDVYAAVFLLGSKPAEDSFEFLTRAELQYQFSACATAALNRGLSLGERMRNEATAQTFGNLLNQMHQRYSRHFKAAHLD